MRLASGAAFDADLVLWGTGYETDLQAIARRCGDHFLALDAPNLFILAPGVLETSGSAPWAYAHAAKSIMSHIRGNTVFDRTPVYTNANYFDLARFLAKRDRVNYPAMLWYLKYLNFAFRQPANRPMPIP